MLLGLRGGLEWERSKTSLLAVHTGVVGRHRGTGRLLIVAAGGYCMARSRRGRGYECVVIDVNTQKDFCDRSGAFPVANVAELIPAMRRVIAWTRRNHAPVVSTVESHRPRELSDNGHPIYCVDGSPGQQKIAFTVLPLRVIVEVDNTFSVPSDLFRHWQQVLFRKRTDDLLANPKADCLLTHLSVKEYILFGTGLECSIKALALALLAREKAVTVVTDACGYWQRPVAELALRQVAAKGAVLINADQLMTRKLDRPYRYGKNGVRNPDESENGRLPGGALDPTLRADAEEPTGAEGESTTAAPHDYQI